MESAIGESLAFAYPEINYACLGNRITIIYHKPAHRYLLPRIRQ
jgi:hypothetical protein